MLNSDRMYASDRPVTTSWIAAWFSNDLKFASGKNDGAVASWDEPTCTAIVTSELFNWSLLVIVEPGLSSTTTLSTNKGTDANVTLSAREGRIVAAIPLRSICPAAWALNRLANGTSTHSGSTSRSANINLNISTLKPVGSSLSSRNWIGGKVRSTPIFAVPALTILSRIDSPPP